MNGNLIHALLIEDNPTDADLIQEKLEVARRVSWDLPCFAIEHVVRLKEALACLENGAFDVVLSDLDLPDSRAGETITTLREHIPHMPIVVLTGREDEALAQKSVRAGVQDYLYKNEATGSLLARTMMYAIERQQAQAKLERRVSERTAELRQVNRELETEIVERKQAEDALRESERRYRELFENSRDGFVIVDAKGRFLDANRAYCQMLGYTLDELRQKEDFYDITPPRWHDWERREIWEKRLLQEGYSGIYEKEYIRKDGNVFPVELQSYAFFEEDGELRYLWGIARDITDRKRAEEALRKGKERYLSLFERVPVGLYRTTPSGQYLDANQAMVDMLGCPDKETLLERNAATFYANPQDRQRWIAMMDREEIVRGIEVKWRRYDGEAIWVQENALTVRDENGRVICYEGSVENISEHKRVEGMLRERTAQLEVLQEVSAAITAQLDLEELLQNIAEEGCRLLSAQGSSIYLVDEKQGDLEQIVSHGYERNHTSTRMKPGEGLAGKVFESGEAMSVDDYHQWEGRSPRWKDERITGSLCVPLKCGGEIIGTLGFEELGEARTFDNQDIWLAKLFANHAAIAIRNVRLYEEAQQRALEQEALREAALAMTTALERDEVIERILAQLKQVVSYDTASVLLLRGDQMEIVGGQGFPNPSEIVGLTFPLNEKHPNEKVARTREPVILADAPQVYEKFKSEPHAQANIRSWLGVPMLVGNRLIGMLALDKSEPYFYGEEHIQLTEVFAAQAAIAIHNAQLYEQAQHNRGQGK